VATKDNSFNNPEKISIAGCKNEGEQNKRLDCGTNPDSIEKSSHW